MVLIVSWGMWPKVTRAAPRRRSGSSGDRTESPRTRTITCPCHASASAGSAWGSDGDGLHRQGSRRGLAVRSPTPRSTRRRDGSTPSLSARRLRLVSGVFFNGILNQVRSALPPGSRRRPTTSPGCPRACFKRSRAANQPYGTRLLQPRRKRLPSPLGEGLRMVLPHRHGAERQRMARAPVEHLWRRGPRSHRHRIPDVLRQGARAVGLVEESR